MGNAESQSVEHAFYGEKRASLGRKHTSRSLRLSHKARRSRHSHAATGKAPPRRAEASARSSSTPSLPQALAENGLEPFAAQGALEGFGDPLWADRVEMGLRPVSYTGSSVAPSVDSSVALATTSVQSMLGSEGGAPRPAEGGRRPRPCACPAPGSAEAAGFQKKRSKSADLWREDSLELSLSDLSQEPLSSREDILGAAGERDGEEARAGPRPLGACPRATSLGDLGTPSGGRCAGHCRDLAPDTPRRPHRAEEAAYSAYNTLPCRRSHCLSEGATGPPLSLGSLQGRRARTAQDVNAGEGSEFADSGIEGAATDPDLLSRRSNATHSSYSPPPGRAFAGSDSGSSSAGDAARQGVYENFRRELELGASRESPEEAGSAHSDERSSGRSDGALQAAARGTVRKAGALAVKNLLVHKKSRKVEPAARRRWKHYWAALRGCTLLFYDSDGRSGIEPGSVPKHAVWVENGVVQAVPEHPKKDFVFCLSNCLGDAFLFQTTSQTELENWVTAIHSACSAAVARHHHKEDTLRLLKSEIKKLEQKIDMDEKMKKMGEMQLSSVTDSKKKKTILDQIFVWEQNLEQFQMDLFRYRCYLASLQGGELPNPKRLLAFASRPTKVAMGRLGIFSVSSFHALVAARTAETGVRRRTQAMAHSTSKRRSRFSSLWGLDSTSKKKQGHPSINQVFSEGPDAAKQALEEAFDDAVPDGKVEKEMALPSPHQQNPDCDMWAHQHFPPSWFCLPGSRSVLTVVRPGDCARDTLEAVCKTHQLDPAAHCLRLRFLVEDRLQVYEPQPEEELYELLFQEVEICPKAVRSLQLEKSDAAGDSYGFSLSSVEEDGVRRLYVSSVRDTGLAAKQGLTVGDEVLEISSRVAASLSSAALRDFLSQPSLGLLVRTRPELEGGALLLGSPPHRADSPAEPGHSLFAFLAGSPGPSLGGSQGSSTEPSPEEAEGLDPESSDDTDQSSKSTEQGAVSCRSPRGDMDPGGPQPAARQLTDADKLRKVICELLETERTYVKDLNCLMERYLRPLQKETFLTQDELDVLFGNLTEMVEFQVEFLKTLEDGVRLVPDLEKLERVDQFKKVLFSLGGSFLYYADRFKLYSAFCASHTKVPKVLVKARTDAAFKAFLDAQNPRQQHSATLESYLIKPIQRVLKYPLLLRELFALTHVDSEEHYHLDVAIKTMNKVASHINEMQKIHEEFGAVFDQLIAEQTGEKKEVADLSMGDLLLHTTVTWPNPPASLGKWKKEPELAAFVFKTAVVLVYKDGSKQKRRLVGSHRLSIYEEWDPFRFRHMIPTEALQLRAVASADADADTACEIVHVKSESEGRPERVFHLCCGSPKSRKDLLKAVHSVLRDKHRRQLLKAESLPSSQQYVPFGGRRLCALKGARPAMSRAVSAPSRSLGRRRRRLARNRFTVDADAVPGSPERPPGADTDRWVEEQFDLAPYEEPEEPEDLPETDILSDDDGEAAEAPGAGAGLAGRLQAASLGPRGRLRGRDPDRDRGRPDGHAARMAQLRKQAALPGGPEPAGPEVVWVRREELASPGALSTEI
ncbi:rho guanine nucleotide exchange factor TIAM1 isoform X1 [Pipistrellus kuhlii]|uniref:TIAM Rac1 associated GEF 1 n=2 Tax=Pipistrellus kuhlii TaxID=59472 RepID=A0A7J7R4F7_PIPKU|nr:rho guanine nucleotide exchange factor TIAM1 isoform X1 [Pipistrellus kuhlii]XP_045434329.1 rho guanine nucleotide exchange factor TIAM1 isoform X1 [Pipistrellus kuhlii]KAF6271008.1 TIAM Rac1 associated GEF 1 [Pipistrellus kuhlii]